MLKCFVFCEFIIIIYDLLNDIGAIVLMGDLVIRKEPVRLPTHLAYPALYEPYYPVASGFLLAPLYPLLVYEITSTVGT